VSGALGLDGTVVVAGASLAGLRATQALRDGGFRGRIVMVGEEPHPPYDRPPLSKQVLAGTWSADTIALADAGQLAELGVELRLGHRAVALDAVRRRVTIDDGVVVDADGVVIATGARPRRLLAAARSDPPQAPRGTPARAARGQAAPESTGDVVRVIRTIEDTEGLRARIDEVGPGCRVAVVGGGFIGSEVAATCSGLGCAVTVLEALPTPLAPAVGERVGAALGELHSRHGVALRTSAVVESVSGGSPDAQVVLADGDVVTADVVVAGIGVVPNTEWLEGSGLEVDDGVVCDHALFAADGIVAAGDLARWRWRHGAEEEDLRIEHWEVAAQMGAAAGRSLLAGRRTAPAFDPVPYFWSDQYGLKIQVLGHPDPTDEVAVVMGSLDGPAAVGRGDRAPSAEEAAAAGAQPDASKFVVVFGRRGRLSAVLAVSRPRQLMAFRPLLVAGASFDEAIALLEGG